MAVVWVFRRDKKCGLDNEVINEVTARQGSAVEAQVAFIP